MIASREWVTEALSTLDFEVLPSEANFVFARHKTRDAKELAQQLREEGVLVRHFTAPRIEQFLRITIGTEEQNQTLIDVLQRCI